MAYPIEKDVLDLFLKPYRQTALISFNGTEEELTLTEKDIIQGGFTLDRYTVSGSRIEIGSAVAAELKLTLNNKDGKFDKTVFEGAELFVKIGVKKWDAHVWEKAKMHYIPLGYFTVDNSPRRLTDITLTALDRMVMFDKLCTANDLTFPTTIADLLVAICRKCGVSLSTVPETLTNHDYTVSAFPEKENLTYRQILMWIGELTGTCAYIDWDGKLRLSWYSDESSAVFTPAVRYESDLDEKPVVITGLQIKTDDETYLYGTAEYAFNIEGNGLLQNNIETAASALYEKLNGFTYTPYSCTTKPFICLYPLDRIGFTDKSGNVVSSIVTNTTFSMNTPLSVAGQGETATSEGYATNDPLTNRESAILNRVKKNLTKQISSREQALLDLNKTLVNSMGLYFSEETLDDGSTVFYYHDKPEKSESGVIYTFRAGGFAWTDDWNNGNPVWQNGIDRDGNAVLKVLSANRINADHIAAGSITADRLAVSFTKTLVTQDDLAKSEATLHQELVAQDGTLKSLISQTETDANEYTDTKTATLSSEITQLTDRISLVVTSSDTGEETIDSASIVAAINSDADGNTSVIKLSADAIDLTGFVTFTDLKKTDGSTVIDGSCITTGFISSDRIETEGLGCTKIHEVGNENGVYASINSSFGDFGLYGGSATASDPRGNDCIWGFYNTTGDALNFYVYGDNYFGYNYTQKKAYPKGKWDFSSCEVLNLGVVPVFGE